MGHKREEKEGIRNMSRENKGMERLKEYQERRLRVTRKQKEN